MRYRRFFVFIFLLLVVAGQSKIAHTQTLIEITTPMVPPGWSLWERELLRANTAACFEFADKYLDDRGFVMCVERWGAADGPNDAMDNFHNWPLLYALGAPESILQLYYKAWEGHLRQYTKATAKTVPITKDGMYYKEFIVAFDWEHNAKFLAAFNLQGLADPTNLRWQQRARRYAGFYMNEDPEAPNYDPEHKIIKSLHNGSKGPKLTPATVNDWAGDLESSHANFVTADNIKGDHPVNLGSTALAMNAYMIANEQKYKDWLLEYAGAWRDRIVTNGGNIPTNIGLDGTIGGEWDGKWYGGVFGWNFWPESDRRNYFCRGAEIGFGAALLISGGDQSFVDVLRMQMDNIYAAKRIEKGTLLLPHKYGDDGWYGYNTLSYVNLLREIYCWSMNPKDKERIADESWIKFLDGNNPGFPEEALRNEFVQLQNSVQGLRQDNSSPDTRRSDHAYKYTPAQTDTLVNLMLGGNEVRQVGNLLHCRVRYFDPARNRAGIPEDVASLVTEMNEELTKVTLVNINQVEPRDVIVQTGAYGEHQCIRVETGGSSVPVNNRFFSVRLAPGAGAELIIYQKRYANKPTLAFPWHGDSVPSY